MIETTEPVLRYHEDRQLHVNRQIAPKIIGSNRDEPAADSFHDDVLHPILKRVKSGQNILDVDVHLFGMAAHNRRRRRPQPNGINIVNCQTGAASRQQQLCILAVSTADRFHSGARGS